MLFTGPLCGVALSKNAPEKASTTPNLNYRYNQIEDLPPRLKRPFNDIVGGGLDESTAFQIVTGHRIGGGPTTIELVKVEKIDGYEGVDISQLGIYVVDKRFVLEMPKMADGPSPWTNVNGYLRSPALFWGKIYELCPELFDPGNVRRLELNLSPINGDRIRNMIPSLDIPESPTTDVLHHHHIGGGGQAGILPHNIHLSSKQYGIQSTRKVENDLNITNYWEKGGEN